MRIVTAHSLLLKAASAPRRSPPFSLPTCLSSKARSFSPFSFRPKKKGGSLPRYTNRICDSVGHIKMAQPTGKNNHNLQIISILKSSVLSFENVKRPDIPTKMYLSLCIFFCAFCLFSLRIMPFFVILWIC